MRIRVCTAVPMRKKFLGARWTKGLFSVRLRNEAVEKIARVDPAFMRVARRNVLLVRLSSESPRMAWRSHVRSVERRMAIAIWYRIEWRFRRQGTAKGGAASDASALADGRRHFLGGSREIFLVS